MKNYAQEEGKVQNAASPSLLGFAAWLLVTLTRTISGENRGLKSETKNINNILKVRLKSQGDKYIKSYNSLG